jgi:uncharacterized membrane protein
MSRPMAKSRSDRHIPVRRLEALFDGVFAIAITLLALEVSVPIVDSVRSADLVDALVDEWPSYIAYAVTFFIIGAYWVNSHRIFTLLRGIDHTFQILTILFLMAIAIIPFPNAVLAEYLTDPALRGVATQVYGLGMLVLAVMFNVVSWYAYRRGLFRPDVDQAKVRKVLMSYLAGPALFFAGLVLSFWTPELVLILFVLVPFAYLFEGPIRDIDEGYIGTGE